MLTRARRRKQHVISVPMTPEEIRRLARYLDDTGLKKGRVFREALRRYLDEEESNGKKEIAATANRRSSGD